MKIPLIEAGKTYTDMSSNKHGIKLKKIPEVFFLDFKGKRKANTEV